MNSARLILLILVAVGSVNAVRSEELIERQGRYIHLTTDLSSGEEIDALIRSFDSAVEQWFEFWRVDDSAVSSWKTDAYVIRNRERFLREGLIPDEVPDFPFGYALGNRLWVLAQASEYYTRHLLLHEGAHSLAFHLFGGAGPTWFMEGTAEMLATHLGVGDEIQVNQVPAHRQQVPYWGRFKLIDQLRSEGKIPPLETVMRYQAKLLDNVEPYSWSWAAAMLFHAYPEYREAFFAAARRGRETGPQFNRRFYQELRDQWPIVVARWRLLCQELDYGFDWSCERVDLSLAEPVWDGRPLSVSVAANAGWQSIGVRLPGTIKIRLAAEGQVVLENAPKPWLSTPTGVTIRYHEGRPLGQLVACILPNAVPDAASLEPLPIHTVPPELALEVDQFSWLLLRVNDHPQSVVSNQGSYQVDVSR